MKVKQLIYTSWKNGSSTKKGFMVYSQSEGLSADDVNLITRNMRYVTLPSLPYSPTWEQIETMFPRNDAYFQLPSGSWCMAQSSYLGKDYSGRLGNYIIHAYISPVKPDFDAINLIGSDAYRRSLTEAELEAESNPPALPEVELRSPDVSGDAALLKGFFNSDRIAKLKYLVAAVIRAVKNNEKVYLNDEKDNLPMWYKALNFCLPAETLSRVTYATYSCVMADGITIQSVKAGGTFNYKQQLAGGALVYDFKDNVINDKVEVGKFVNIIVDEFAADPRNAKALVTAMGDYIAEAGGDPDLAVDLSWFYEGHYDRFPDGASLTHIFNAVTAGNRLAPSALAGIFGGLIIGNPSYPIAQYPDMYKYILANGDKQTYFAVVAQYVGLCTAKSGPVSSYDSMYEDAVNNAPFNWRSYLDYVAMRGSKADYINKYGAQSYPAYLLAVSEINFGNPVDEQLVILYARTIARLNDLTLFKNYLNRLSQRGMKENVCDKIAAAESADGGIFASIDYDKIYAVLDAMAIDGITIKVLLALLNNCYDANGFIDKFTKYITGKPQIYSAVEKAAAYDAAAKRYIDSTICDKFLSKTPDENALNDFYAKYFPASQQMREVFLQGLESYLNAQRDQKTKIHASLAWFNKLDRWYSNRTVDTARMDRIETIVKNTVFSLDFDKFCAVYKSETPAVNEFVRGYKARNGVAPCDHLEVINLGAQFESVDEKRFKTNAFLNDILNNGTLGNYEQKTLRTIADKYFDEVFRVLMILVREGERDAATVYANAVIIKLAEASRSGGYGGSTFNERLMQKIREFNAKDLSKALPVLICASVAYSGKSPIADVLDKYIDQYKRKKLKALYDDMLHDKTLRSEAAFCNYMEGKIAVAKRGLFEREEKKPAEAPEPPQTKRGMRDRGGNVPTAEDVETIKKGRGQNRYSEEVEPPHYNTRYNNNGNANYNGAYPAPNNGNANNYGGNYPAPNNGNANNYGGNYPAPNNGNANYNGAYPAPNNGNANNYGGNYPAPNSGNANNYGGNYSAPNNGNANNYGGNYPAPNNGNANSYGGNYPAPNNGNANNYGGNYPAPNNGNANNYGGNYPAPNNGNANNYGGNYPAPNNGNANQGNGNYAAPNGSKANNSHNSNKSNGEEETADDNKSKAKKKKVKIVKRK